MKKRIWGALFLLLLAALIWREGRAWRAFHWAALWQHAAEIHIGLVLLGTALIYLAFVIRAYRWKLLLRPLCASTVSRVLGPTLVGFTSVSLLGRAGEFVRPYLLARRENVSVSSQLAVWLIERLLDGAGFAVVLAFALVASPTLRSLPHMHSLRQAFLAILIAVVVAAAIIVLMRKQRDFVARFSRRVLMLVSPRLATRADTAISAADAAFAGTGSAGALLQVGAVSVGMWIVIALAYWSVVGSLPSLGRMSLGEVVVLIAFNVAGGLIQLPGGGVAQLAVIAALVSVFRATPDVAVTCGILLWLSTYMAPVPAGLVLLHRYGLSLRGLSRQSHGEERGSAGA